MSTGATSERVEAKGKEREEEGEQWFAMIHSKKKLDRDRGIAKLAAVLESGGLTEERRARLETELLELAASLTAPWEEKHGGLMAAGAVVRAGGASKAFCERLEGEIPLLLEHREVRIRLSAGEVLGQLCRHCGSGVFSALEPVVTLGIRENLERDVGESEGVGQSHGEEEEEERPRSPSADQIFHDTAGWRSLESYMVALEQSVVGCGSSFEAFITPDLLQLVFTALKHTNRFVRETAFKVIAAIVKIPGLSPVTVETHWPAVAQHLAQGLADNWSQVRMAASVATREFLAHIDPPDDREMYFPTLIPAMCLNRYYVAEGVRLFSQETWRIATGNKGVQIVERYIEHVVEFYISQSQAANHAVREAACTCIAELGTKVSHDCLRPHIVKLVGVLLECFKDDSWPVRDAACLACGNFITCFPDECRPSLDELFLLFFGNLEDSIPSVRQGAAVALGNVVQAYGSDVEERVFSAIKERLPLAASQPAGSTDRFPDLEPGPGPFGVVRRVEDSQHTDQQMYSCGSLAPKMRRGGCMDSAFHKPAQPWEKSEGCIHLLAELGKQRPYTDKVASLLPALAEACRHKHYPQHLSLLETTLKQLPVLAKALGKRPFKRHLELFLESIFYGLSSDRALVHTAASECLVQLTQQLGRMIMRGRVEQFNPKYLESYDKTVARIP